MSVEWVTLTFFDHCMTCMREKLESVSFYSNHWTKSNFFTASHIFTNALLIIWLNFLRNSLSFQSSDSRSASAALLLRFWLDNDQRKMKPTTPKPVTPFKRSTLQPTPKKIPFLTRYIFGLKWLQVLLSIAALVGIYFSLALLNTDIGLRVYAVAVAIMLVYTLDFILVFSCAGISKLALSVKFTLFLLEVGIGACIVAGMAMYHYPSNFSQITNVTDTTPIVLEQFRILILVTGIFNAS